ncbi:hypothetical protein [Aliivibrio fischeri]|nr:hypothetical protein [Aliivibrio fischeri]
MINNINILLFSSLLIISGCLDQKIHRDIFSIATCNNEENCQRNSLQKLNNKTPYTLSFIEIDDQGFFSDRSQFDVLKKHIENKTRKNNTFIYVYVHGWQHNASINDSNVKHFKEQLNKISNQLSLSKREVIGIYIGWRGKTSSVPLLKYLTFWDRKNSAKHIADKNIIEIWRFLRKLKNNSISDTKILTVGHSFGAEIVFTAINKTLVNDLIDSTVNKQYKTSTSGLGDLVLLINPTFDALKYAHFQNINERHNEFLGTQKPILSIFTSESDWITKYIFPAGNTISRRFEPHRYMKTTIGEENVLINQNMAEKTSIGHFKPFITHRLEMKNKNIDISSTQRVNLINDLKSDWASGVNPLNFSNTRLIRNPIIKAKNPYLVVQVDKALMPNHNNFFGKEIDEFLNEFILFSID